MDAFWRVYNAPPGEDGAPVIGLLDKILECCEGHYTVWMYRRLRVLAEEQRAHPEGRRPVFEAGDLDGELEWLRRFAVDNPKNYQVWQHRQWITDQMGGATAAAELDANIADFMREPKNYHAWQYRQWLLRRFGGPVSAELDLVDELLRIDVYNNSAWNHRCFVWEVLGAAVPAWQADEAAWAQRRLSRDPANQSARNYVDWLARRSSSSTK